MFFRLVLFAQLLVLFALVFFIPCARADIAHYVDKDGTTHFVDSAEKIPEEYRSQSQSQGELPKISRSVPGRTKLYEKDHYAGAEAGGGKVEIFVTSWCPYCRALESFLKAQKITYTRHDIEKSAQAKMMYEELGGGGIPISRVGNKVLRGFNEAEFREALALPR